MPRRHFDIEYHTSPLGKTTASTAALLRFIHEYALAKLTYQRDSVGPQLHLREHPYGSVAVLLQMSILYYRNTIWDNMRQGSHCCSLPPPIALTKCPHSTYKLSGLRPLVVEIDINDPALADPACAAAAALNKEFRVGSSHHLSSSITTDLHDRSLKGSVGVLQCSLDYSSSAGTGARTVTCGYALAGAQIGR